MSYICCVSQDRPPPGTAGSVYLPEHPCPGDPAACSRSGQPLLPGCPLAGLGCSRMHAPARAGAGRIGSK